MRLLLLSIIGFIFLPIYSADENDNSDEIYIDNIILNDSVDDYMFFIEESSADNETYTYDYAIISEKNKQYIAISLSCITIFIIYIIYIFLNKNE